MKVFVVSGDAGGAQCVHAVCHELRRRNAALEAWVYGPGHGVFQDGAKRLPEAPTSPEAAREMLSAFEPDVLLLGTSVNKREDEKVFLKSARTLGIPSIAVLDFWSNYHGRFATRPAPSPLDALPDRIAVMDGSAARDLEALGIPSDRIAVTGQPAFDRLHETPPSPGEIRSLRESMGCGSDQRLVLFASQPFRELATQHGMAPVPFDEIDLAQTVLASVHEIDACLWIRPHPREASAKFRPLADQGAIVATTGSSIQALHAADDVVGMSSVFLLEAGILGKRVLSLQPGVNDGGPLPLARLGLGTVITHHGCDAAIREWFTATPQTHERLPQPSDRAFLPGAAARVVDEIEFLASR